MEQEYMYYCNDCGSITEGEEDFDRLSEDPHGWYRYYRCTACGSDNITDAAKCPICGEWHEDNTYSELCPECFEDIISDFRDTFTNIAEAYPNARPIDIIEGMGEAFEEWYDKIQDKYIGRSK